MVVRFKALIRERTGKEFPQDPWKQLWGAVGAVFGSWMNDRAMVYRRKYNIPSEWGTAVNIQAMVYGNTGENSGSGVAFTRDPATGEKIGRASCRERVESEVGDVSGVEKNWSDCDA